MNKKQLAIILSQLKENQKAKPELEQYTIPGELAAQIINIAHLSGDIKDKRVLDLGCGSGRLGIGALIMGAKEVIGVDVDKSVLKTAKENVKITENLTKKRIKDKISFVHSDIISFKEKADTVIQNPPFGIQKIHADRLFLERALESSEKIYSLHRSYSKTRNFLKKFIKEKNGKVERIIKFKFRIPYMFRFHKKPHIEYDVDLLIISKV